MHRRAVPAGARARRGGAVPPSPVGRRRGRAVPGLGGGARSRRTLGARWQPARRRRADLGEGVADEGRGSGPRSVPCARNGGTARTSDRAVESTARAASKVVSHTGSETWACRSRRTLPQPRCLAHHVRRVLLVGGRPQAPQASVDGAVGRPHKPLDPQVAAGAAEPSACRPGGAPRPWSPAPEDGRGQQRSTARPGRPGSPVGRRLVSGCRERDRRGRRGGPWLAPRRSGLYRGPGSGAGADVPSRPRRRSSFRPSPPRTIMSQTRRGPA